VTIDVHGAVAPRFAALERAFADAFAGRPSMGAALAVRHHGEMVVDLWAGLADPRTRSPWNENTATVIFSCTKGLLALLAARLVQEGRLDYDAPVTDYWPEFGAAGKHTITVTELLAHRAGLSAPREPLTVNDIVDWSRMTATLARQTPLWQPGSGHSYHAITYGWLAGELIRRVTGESVGTHFQRAIATPLHQDAWIGLPDNARSRVAHVSADATLQDLIADEAAHRDINVPDWSEKSMTLGGALPPELVGEESGFNDPRIQAAEVPGAGGIATARALASIWSSAITTTDGVRLLSAAIMQEATQVQTEGAPIFGSPGPWPRWGRGFQLDSQTRRYLTASGFGHDGAGGQVAFADPDTGIGFAFLTNQMEGREDTRATHIIDSLRALLKTLPS